MRQVPDMQEFEFKTIPSRTVFCLPCKGPWRQLPDMLARLSVGARQAGMKVVGSPGAFYYNSPGDVAAGDLDWEVFYEVVSGTSEWTDAVSGFGVRSVPETTVAAMVHYGHYSRAGASYRRLNEWIRVQGLSLCGPSEEAYLTELNGKAEDTRIEIRLPVVPVAPT
jgi:effector-binding domain-containing protein